MSTEKIDKLDQYMTTDFTDVFADSVDSIIDGIHPHTGRSIIHGETLEQIRLRYPNAVRMSFADWQDRKVATQETPIRWTEVTEHKYQEMLEVLPPIGWHSGGFLVGEPWDHHAGSGRPRFQAYITRNGRYYASSRPLTVPEFKKLDYAGNAQP